MDLVIGVLAAIGVVLVVAWLGFPQVRELFSWDVALGLAVALLGLTLVGYVYPPAAWQQVIAAKGAPEFWLRLGFGLTLFGCLYAGIHCVRPRRTHGDKVVVMADYFQQRRLEEEAVECERRWRN